MCKISQLGNHETYPPTLFWGWGLKKKIATNLSKKPSLSFGPVNDMTSFTRQKKTFVFSWEWVSRLHSPAHLFKETWEIRRFDPHCYIQLNPRWLIGMLKKWFLQYTPYKNSEWFHAPINWLESNDDSTLRIRPGTVPTLRGEWLCFSRTGFFWISKAPESID